MSDVFVPFRIKVPAGHSTFTVNVPRVFNNKIFSVAELFLVPSNYSLLAEDFNLDTDDELDDPVNYDVHLKIEIIGDLYPFEFTLPTQVQNTPDVARLTNIYFDVKKPVGIKNIPFFFDWTDLRFLEQPPDVSWDHYVRTTMALSYYGVPFKEELHYNALPLSAQNVPGANNYLFPTQLNAITLQHLRFRMFFSPNSISTFSTDEQLLSMGFSAEQIGPRRSNRRFNFGNVSLKAYGTEQASNQLTFVMEQKNQLKIGLFQNLSHFTSSNVSCQTTKKQQRKNVDIIVAVKKALEELSTFTNIITSANYYSATSVFAMIFPENNNIAVTIVMPTELTERLGFGLSGEIDHRHGTGQPFSDKPDFENAVAKARALVYDTSIVVVTDDNSRSNTTSDTSENFVANLMPSWEGVLKLTNLFHKAPKMRLPTVFTGSSNKIPATFRLHRYLDSERMMNLQWLEDAYVFGILRGSDSF
jgi:hypothetical protein